jgi:hypothetical protein
MLHDKQEIVGELVAIHPLDGHVFEAQLKTREDEIETILLPVGIRAKFEVRMGKVVGVLRLYGEYHVREVVEA